MKISILCSSISHPVNAYLDVWINKHENAHEIHLLRKKGDLESGDILFLISCVEIIEHDIRSRFKKVLIVHASDLPLGRGWSPHIWQLIEGKENITLSLLEAEKEVDSGNIWRKILVHIPRHALWNEINKIICEAELKLMDFAIDNFHKVESVPQNDSIAPTHYHKRTPEDSKIDPEQSIAAQFNLIRVCDPTRYPAFFELHGYRYRIVLEKME